jgi:GTPase SAR1 family protein
MSDSMKNADKVRILVLGDSGVGKTSLIELVCSGEELRKPRSTVGCAVHMKIHESRATVCPRRPPRARIHHQVPGCRGPWVVALTLSLSVSLARSLSRSLSKP